MNFLSDKKPMNDVIDHLNNVEGTTKKIEIEKYPKPIRLIGYLCGGFLGVSMLLAFIGWIFSK